MAVKAGARKTTAKKSTAKKPSSKKSSAKTTAKSSANASPRKPAASKAATSGSGGKAFKPGDKVAWDTSQGETTGKVVKKQTTPTKIKTHKVAASKDNPQYIVESEKSGKRAAHKPEELRKRS